MENEKIYVKGLNTFTKHANAPDFVLGEMVICPNELFKWMKEPHVAEHLTEYKGEKQLKCTIAMGKDEKVKFTINTWKPQATPPEPTKQEKFDDNDSLPF